MEKKILALLLVIICTAPACKWLSNPKVNSEDKVVRLLNVALAEEWLAAYQYWIGAQIIKGALGQQAEAEFIAHYQEELKHAQQLADRIIQLDETPVLNPNEWLKLSPKGYDHPSDFSAKALIGQNIDSEKRAIKRYEEILALVHGKDHATYDMVSGILRDEMEHEQDLERLVE
ncbi:hypothetical protein KAU11_05290 [Candidatus Babeliales bacterium]|nr:hypothetical protein [Candidatus Babeliales bacterium]